MASKRLHVRKVTYEYTGDIAQLQENLMERSLSEEGGLLEALRGTISYYWLGDGGLRFNGSNLYDTIIGGSGEDRLSGKGGNDVLLGYDGDDTLNGGNGNDTLYGDAGDDWLIGGKGDDTLVGGDGNNTLDGGDGIDTAVYGGVYYDYSIRYAGPNVLVQSLGEGFINDLLINMELIQFNFDVYDINRWRIGGDPYQTSPLTDVAPVASGDSFATLEDTTVFGSVPGSDSDANGGTVSVTPFSGTTVAGGAVSLSADGSFIYTPALHFSGADSFDYVVSDGQGGTESASVALSVTGVADAPSLSVPGVVSATFANETDTLRVPLDISASLTDTDGSEVLHVRVSGLPTGATLSAGALQGDGSWLLNAGEIAGVMIDLPPIVVDDFQLAIVAEAQELTGGAIAISDGVVSVDVTAWLADAPAPDAPPVFLGTSPDKNGLDGGVVGAIVGVGLQNLDSTDQSGEYVTFGQAFVRGDLVAGQDLKAVVGGVEIAAQLDVKATYDDGSVKHAIITLETPKLPGGSQANVALVPIARETVTAIDPAAILSGGYDLSVSVDIHEPDGTISPYTIDVASVLKSALVSGSYETFLSGDLATEVRIEAPVNDMINAIFDIRILANGDVRTDVILANEWAFQDGLGTVVYDIAISQNGGVVEAHDGLEHYKFSRWHTQITDGDEVPVHVVFDVDYMIESGAIQAYDTSTVIFDAAIQNTYEKWAAAPTGPLETGLNMTYMPTTGQTSGPNIGVHTNRQAVYLLSQDARALDVVLKSADAAGSVAWHMRDIATEEYVTVDLHPKIHLTSYWSNGESLGTLDESLSQTRAYKVDTAHQPAFHYVPYLVTGSHYYLDELHAEATFSVGSYPLRDGWIGGSQLRSAAWTLRTISDASFVTPDDHSLSEYFDRKLNEGVAAVHATLTSDEMDSYGALSGYYRYSGKDAGATSPWEVDYLSQAISYIASRESALAEDVLEASLNYMAGRFTSEDLGFDPYYGVSYRLWLEDVETGIHFTTWEQAFERLTINGAQVRTELPYSSPGSYTMVAKGALAGIITHTQSVDAIEAYGFVVANAPDRVVDELPGKPKWDVAPRLADGTYLSRDNTFIGDLSSEAIVGTSDNELIHGKGGNDTIDGMGGIDLLFGGSGDDVVKGGAGDDFIFGNAGNDTLEGGDGNDILRGNVGADIMRGGNGDDTFFVDELDQVDGGAGFDRIAVQNFRDVTVDLNAGRTTGIEVVDLRSDSLDTAGSNDQVILDFSSIARVSDNGSLYIYGDVDDMVNLTGASTRLADEIYDGITFAHFSDGSSDLFVQLGIHFSYDGFDGPIGL